MYKALDEKRHKIGYIQLREKGKTKEFTNQDYDKLDSASQKKLALREMDCVDCHNRPTHVFKSADAALNQAMRVKLIDPSIPWIKKEGLQILTESAKSKSIGDNVSQQLLQVYKNNYPKIYPDIQDKLTKSAAELQRIYKRNIFPNMNITWNTYKNHLGHAEDLGCFRCHDGDHSTKDKSKAISQDCNTCHYLLYEDIKDKSKIDEIYKKNK